MEDIQLERAATYIIDILTPIKKAIDNFQHQDYYLGECLEICNEQRDQVLTQSQHVLAKRSKMRLLDCTLAANVLDYRFAGSNLMPVNKSETI